MTWTKQITLWCEEDGCEEWTQVNETALRRARKEARGRGWACHTGGDYCPEHNRKDTEG